MAFGSNDISLKVGFDLQRFTDELSKTNSMLSRWGGSIQKELFKAFTIQEGIGMLKRGIESAIGSMAEFQKSMSAVKAITGATQQEFQILRDNALNLGGAFKANDIAKMETELARLGFTTKEIIDTTKTAVQLATATGEDLGKSAEILGSVLRAFNLDAKESARVGEVMASSFNKSALALDNFGESMKYVAPVAAAAGLSIEQTSALLGVLADNGIKGSMAGTSLRKIISDLGQGAAPVLNQKLREMAAAGISGSQAMDEVGRTAYASLLVLSNNTEKIDKYTKANKSANGELDKMSKIMQDNLIGDWKKLEATWDAILNQKGGGILTLLRGIVQHLNNIVRAFASDQISIWEMLFGGPDDYREYVKRIDDAAAKAKQTANDLKLIEDFAAGRRDTSGLSFRSTRPDTPKAPAKSIDPYSHAAAIAATAGRTYGMDLGPDAGSIVGKIPEYTMKVVELGDSFKKASEHLTELGKNEAWKSWQANMKKAQENQEFLNRALVRAGDVAGYAIGQMVTGAQTFTEAVANMARNVVMDLKRIAMAYIVANAAKLGPVGIFLAGVGLGVVESLFSQIANSTSSGGGSVVSDSNLRSREMVGKFTIDGRDLVYAYDLNKSLDASRRG